MSNKSPVWPGPSVLVPIPTDILLIGQGDVNAKSTWADLKNDYYGLWKFGTTAQPKPFSTGTCPSVGAHIMWSLPNSLRQGTQQSTEGAPVDFPLAPNRWLITRFAYNNAGEAPENTSIIVQSDILIDINGNVNEVNQYPYYEDTNLGVRQIGSNIPLENYTGDNSGSIDIKAIGPGDVSWSVTYDNIKNVFALHDDLPDKTQTYTYSIVGWYANPEMDPLYNLPTDSDSDWLAMLEQKFKWTSEDVEKAIEDWTAWQEEYGLSGTWDPSNLNLPDQAKSMIEAWHDWQQVNGITGDKPDLPTQTLCHSMIATVQWRGKSPSYGSGAPIGKDGKQKLPTLAIANTPESSISIYMATKASEVPGSGITPADIPNLATALEAFQRDLLFDLQTDPVWAESMIHDAKFDKKKAGHEWIVVRVDDTSNQPDTEDTRSGQQSIPLNEEDTESLISLNTNQSILNDLHWTIITQQMELYALAMKKEYLEYNRSFIDPTDFSTLSEKVSSSIGAISGALNENKSQQATLKNQIEVFSEDLQKSIDPTIYTLKVIDIDPVSAPADPVVLISGGELDTKLLPPVDSGEPKLLPIRFTGQTITAIDVTYTVIQPDAISITWKDVLDKITVASWNAFPKEVQGLWLEALFLDTSNAMLIASIYFEKAGEIPEGNQLAELTTKIQEQQTACWTEFKTVPPTEPLTLACGFEGLFPDSIGVAYRPNKNPWTPVFMDWKIKWIPSYTNVSDALKDWTLGELDYKWQGSNLTSPSPEIEFQGRSVLNLKTTQNIQTKFTMFKNDPNYQNLPENTVDNLEWVAENIGYTDMVTQSMSGLTQQLNTYLNTMKNEPLDSNIQELLNANTFFDPVTGTTNQQTAEPFSPIRSGHFQVMDLWLVDSYGQVLKGKSNLLGPNDPVQGIIWSTDMITSSPNYSGDTQTYGQLPPRITQDAIMTPRFLQKDNDTIITNSSDSTSPICGWVMPNHLNDSLMVFDAEGKSQGEIIKVRRESTGDDNNLTIRWDNTPGLDTALGAAPNLDNEHLQKFVNDLLATGTTSNGAMAYTEFLSTIDSTLWINNTINEEGDNLAILMGRPLAVVRGEVELNLSGDPAYNQSWHETGKFYDNNGVFDPQDPPFVSVDFNVRIGDNLMKKNGVMGYFEADDYTKFYAVYGAGGQTQKLQQLLKTNGTSITMDQMKSTLDTESSFLSGYVITDHLVSLAANQGSVKLTLLMDPNGDMPIVSGSLTGSSISLPNGPVSIALENLSATFRQGPLLLNPNRIKMPTPAEIRGDWAWIARNDVTEWQPDKVVVEQTPNATLTPDPVSLTEGWLKLSSFNKKK